MEERLLLEYFGEDAKKLADAHRRLKENEPLAYILGETVFYDETYKVSPAVLIPRPDTERVVEWVLKTLPVGGRFLDICTGSGCIAISALCHSENTTAVAVDISLDALGVAQVNAILNDVSTRLTFVKADILQGFPLEEEFDVIVSNPPYIQTDVIVTLEEECHREPYIAFDGGTDGGNFYRAMLESCPSHLKKGGKIIFEIGYDQKPLMQALCKEKDFFLNIYKDYSKNDRVAVIIPEEHYEEEPNC